MDIVAGENERGGSHSLINCTLSIYRVKVDGSIVMAFLLMTSIMLWRGIILNNGVRNEMNYRQTRK